MADLSSILGGMVQGFKDFGTGLVDMFGTGGAAIGDLFQSGGRSTKNQDDFRKWLYQTDNTQDAAAKGLGTILNGVQTVSDFIPGAGAVTRNPLFNGVQGAIGGVADEFKMAGKDYDLGRAAQRAGVGAASGLASAYTNQALGKTGNKLINNGLVRGAAGGALAGGIANAGYTGIEGGSVQDMINAGLYGARTGAIVGGATGLARELIKPTHKMDVALTDDERRARIANIDDQLAKLDTSTQEGIDRHNELMTARIKYEQPQEYMMSHRPTRSGIYADDLLAEGEDGLSYPKDVYDKPQNYTFMYTDTPDVMNETMAQLNAVRGNPNGEVTIYRATPGNTINDGDWITLSESYAKLHNDTQLDGKGNVLSQKVNVRDIQPAMDDLAEWGYFPQKKAPTNVADLMAESKPKTYYHGSPETDITEFDMSRAGKNTRSGEKAIYFTDDPATAEEFSYERTPTDSLFFDKKGRKGGVYEANLDMKNTLDLGNLSDAQIEELWQYASPLGKLDGKEGFIKDMKHLRQVGNDQLIKSKLDLSALANSPYDSFQAKMYPGENDIREYGIFDASKAKITKSPKTVADLMVEKKTPSNVAELMAEKKPTSSKGVTRIGSSQVAPIDKSTLPKGWAELQDIIDRGYMDDITDKFGYESGAWDKLTPEQLRTYILDAQEGPNLRKGWESRLDVFEQMSDSPEEFKKTLLDVASHEAKSKAERAIESLDMPQDQKNAITYAANRANEGWKEEKRYISNYPKGAEGKKGWENNATSEADAEFSDRLGIGRSNTLKQDEVPRGHDAAGQYLPGEYTMAIQPYLNKENSVSTLAHERLHSFQFEAPEGRYDKRVIDAYNELSKDLKPFIHDKKTIQSRYKTVGDTEYWARPIEQEARMVQQYLDNKGFTKNAVAKYRQGEWGKEINPAFDKFFNTLRKLSKKGVALPALTALFGGGAIMAATQNSDKKKKSEVK